MLDRPQIEARDYRNAMARYAGHVQIVTTVHEGLRRGVTITAACSVSDAPPTVLCCLNNGNPNNQVFFDSGIFVLNTLAAHHQNLANAFAGFQKLSTEERFAQGEWDSLVTGAPALTDAIANYDCRVVDMKVYTTHTVLFGEVVGLRASSASPSLVYMDRSYHAL